MDGILSNNGIKLQKGVYEIKNAASFDFISASAICIIHQLMCK